MDRLNRVKLAVAVVEHYGLKLDVEYDPFRKCVSFCKGTVRIFSLYDTLTDDSFKLELERFTREQYDKTSV